MKPAFLGLGDRVGQRLSWGIGDQMLSSLTNFALGVIVARSVGPKQLGAFSLVFATYILALGISRAVTSEPLAVRYSDSPPESLASVIGAAAGTSLVLGGIGTLLSILAAVALPPATGEATLMLGICLPWLLLQDLWRFAFFVAGKQARAFANDLVWAIAMIPLFALLVATNQKSVGLFVAAWGGASAIAALIGILQSRVIPKPKEAFGWLRTHKELAPHFLGEFLTVHGARQLALYGVVAVADLATVGALRAAQILMGPLNVLSMGLRLIAVPEAVRLKKSKSAFFQALVLLSAALASAAVAWGAVLWLLPSQVGSWLVGTSWPLAHSLVLIVALERAALGVSTGPRVGLRSLAAAARSLRTRLYWAPFDVVGTIGGAGLAGAVGAAVGGTTVTLAASAAWWRQFLIEFASIKGPQEATTESEAVSQSMEAELGPAPSRLP